jgi:hypothetical protein
MTPLTIDLDALQELPVGDEFAADDIAGVELLPCRFTCWITCLATCNVTDQI